MTFGDAAYYRKQYVAARERANQWVARAEAAESELELEREARRKAGARIAAALALDLDIRGSDRDKLHRALTEETS